MSVRTGDSSSPSADPHYLRLKEHLIATTGLAYYRDRDDDLCSCTGRRLAELDLPDYASYMGLICDGEAGARELDKLIAQLTIGETFFFRHREMFDALRDTVFPDAIRRNQSSRQLRIWSAGCSFGAEPYSLSILLRRELAQLVAGWNISILATDINRDFLERAREGCFEEWAFRGVPEDLKRECFVRRGKTWSIMPPYREGVTFQYHNLVDDPFPSLEQNLLAFDVILCRNVMIYFSKDITQRIVGRFFDALVAGGWFAVGHAEPNIETFRAFELVNAAGAVVYQKTAAPSAQRFGIEPRHGALPSPPRLPLAIPCNWPLPVVQVGCHSCDAAPLADSDVAALLPPKATCTTRAAIGLAGLRELADAGQLEQALSCCERLRATNSLDPTVHFYHALILEQLGRHHETVHALRRAVYLDRGYVLAHYYLGLTAQRQRHYEAADRSFRNVLALLANRQPDQVVPHADELRVVELEQLTRLHLAALSDRDWQSSRPEACK